MIAKSVVLEESVVIHHPDLVNLYGCSVGTGSRIGTFVEVQRGATIGRNCKISSHTFVCEGVTIEDGVFIGHGVMFINDRKPRAVNADGSLQTDADWALEHTVVKRRASIGSNATILCGVTIGEGALVGAGRRGHARRGAVHGGRGCASRNQGPRRRRGGRNYTGHEQERTMIGIGVVGYGYWGPNLVRNFWEVPGAKLVSVCDMRPERLSSVTSQYPAVEVTGSFDDVLKDPRIDAVAIATPVSSHYELALRALQAGKHVFIEKPMTATAEQAQRLVDEADRRGLVLGVDHTFVYTGAVRKMRELVRRRQLGDIYYYDSVRVNLGLFQHDVNVIWDLAVHDLSIMDYVLPAAAGRRLGDRHQPRAGRARRTSRT